MILTTMFIALGFGPSSGGHMSSWQAQTPSILCCESVQATWKNDWAVFASTLSSLFKRGALKADLEAQFAGQIVNWTGVVKEVRRTGDQVSVQIDMPAKTIDLSDGTTTTVDRLGLTPVGAEAQKWVAIATGTSVRFRTTLKGDGLFPVIGLMQGMGDNAGKKIVIISTEGLELLSAVRK